MDDHLLLYTLLYSGRYEIDVIDATIHSTKTGKPIVWEYAPKKIDPDKKHPSIRIKINNHRKKVTVCRIIWMVFHKCIVPKDFEIHHWNFDPYDNTYTNLIALHKDDHSMIHNEINQEEIDFPSSRRNPRPF